MSRPAFLRKQEEGGELNLRRFASQSEAAEVSSTMRLTFIAFRKSRPHLINNRNLYTNRQKHI